MNIAVFGWYHHQNAGDDRIQYCLTRFFQDHTLAFLPSGRKPSLQFLRTYDAVIIGGGGLFMKSGGLIKNMASWVRKLGIPVAIAGASIETKDPEMIRELKKFLDVCCFAWFRDQGSLDLLGPHPKAFVAPDLTWLYPFPEVEITEKSKTITAICLKPGDGINPQAWRDTIRKVDTSFVSWPFYFEKGGDNNILSLVVPENPVIEEFSFDPIKQSSGVITGRFHGMIFAIQACVPFIAVNTRPKTLRFLEENGLSKWVVPENQPEKLLDLWDEFKNKGDELKMKFREIKRINHVNCRQKADFCLKLLEGEHLKNKKFSTKLKNKLRDLLDLGSRF